MGLASERHDIHSYETHNAQWIGFRQPVQRAARERFGGTVHDTREVNPGEVWEENDSGSSCRGGSIPTGASASAGSWSRADAPGAKLSLDEYYGYIFEHSVPGLPERAAAEGLTPLAYMRRYRRLRGPPGLGASTRSRCRPRSSSTSAATTVAVSSRGPRRCRRRTSCPCRRRIPTRAAGEGSASRCDGAILRGFPTPSGKLEFYSATLAEWGWPGEAVPGYARSHVHPDALPADRPCSSRRSGCRCRFIRGARMRNGSMRSRTRIRSGCIRATPSVTGSQTGNLVRVETEIGHFVLKAWVTEGIRPGIVACSHHMGRWKPGERGQRQLMATVNSPGGVAPHASAPERRRPLRLVRSGHRPHLVDRRRVHQNLTFPVHPDPVSGMHCWHQAVRVVKADPQDREGEIVVDTESAHAVYRRWLAKTLPAGPDSPGGNRRPYWLLRPLKPGRDAYRVPAGVKS